MKILLKITIIFSSLILIQSCTAYNTNLNEAEKFQISDMEEIRRGEACTNNLFGGFSLPYFGDTAIRLKGDESVVTAIKDADIDKVYAVDRKVRNYIFYSKRCTIVFGSQKLEPELKLKDIPTVSDSTSNNSSSSNSTNSSSTNISVPSAPTVPSVPSF